ncbi:DUF1934 domain-containing protein [Paenibacillus thailandensis]|uniref:DUF1934 domain-containing protein n=1 Tax=Paenibacillus thailandensis TaxID=393250 RepID=A0ABW5R1H1_9BACL
MSDRMNVRLKLIGKADGIANVQTYSGEWFRKEKSVYIRYEEPAQDAEAGANVRTLLRYRPGELSLVRRGGLESEQLFAPKARLRGYYRSPYASFELETATSRLAVRQAGEAGSEELPVPPFRLEWNYKLWVGGQVTGKFEIRLEVEPCAEVTDAENAEGGTKGT